MGDPRELEWAKKPDALKESWTARIGTHVYTEFPLQLAFLLDIIEVPESHTGVALAKAFQQMLEAFGLQDRVRHFNLMLYI